MTDDRSLATLLAPIVVEPPAGSTVSVAALHLDTGERAEFATDVVFPSASTIKIAIMAALARAVDEGRFTLDQTVPVTSANWVPGSGVVAHMQDGIELRLRDHAYLMISISDNTTSNVLIDTVGLEAVQAICGEFATANTMLNRHFFGRAAHGEEVENIVTSIGLATLLKHIVTGEIASEELTTWMRELLGKQQHRDRLARSLYDDETVWYGGKTGSIKGVVHDCGVFAGSKGTVTVGALTKDLADPYPAAEWMGKIGEIIADYVR